jgi:toxic protein SymE
MADHPTITCIYNTIYTPDFSRCIPFSEDAFQFYACPSRYLLVFYTVNIIVTLSVTTGDRMQEIAITKPYRHLKVGYFRKASRRPQNQNPNPLQRACGAELKRDWLEKAGFTTTLR